MGQKRNETDDEYELLLRQKIEEGLKDLDEGRSTPNEEVRKRLLGRGPIEPTVAPKRQQIGKGGEVDVARGG